MFQGRDRIHPIVFDIERVERPDRGFAQSTVEHGGQSDPFLGKRLAHYVLQKAVAWHHYAAALQVLQEGPEQENWLS